MARLLILSLLLAFAAADIQSHLVTDLPGLPYQPIFKMYSGFFNVTNSNGKQIHYVFIESQSNPIQDPVVLWLNGGPGCSSMEGLFYENGPFVFAEGSSVLQANNYSWNLNASMLYFEAPAGVGFSTLGDAANINTNDNQTASDNLNVLVQFFKAYPEYSSQEFFITGESYAGVYIPTLAYNIIKYNNQTNSATKINLSGILIGNGCTDWLFDAGAALPYFAYWHTFINDDLYSNWTSLNCSGWNLSDACGDVMETIEDAMEDIFPYDVYRVCSYNSSDSDNRRAAGKRSHTYRRQGVEQFRSPRSTLPECGDSSGMTSYLNNATVREAMHVSNFSGTWGDCVNLNYTIDHVLGSIYLYPNLLADDLIIWHYSGDTDSVVPTIGTQGWINKLNLTESEAWRQWNLNGQVAGYTQAYQEGLRFLTVKGTGHMSIEWKRPQGAHMFWTFLNQLVL
jgi:serine carboxypeptidase-like clade 1